MSVEQVPSKFAKSLLGLMTERGYDYAGMLAAAGIPFDPRDERGVCWQEYISVLQYSKLYQQVLSQLQDETFGLAKDQGVTPGAFRMMCYCIISCEDLGRAIKRASEFYRTFFTTEAQLTFDISGEVAVVGYAGVQGRTADQPVDVGDAYALSVWHRFFSWLIGRSIELREVRFRGAAPASLEKCDKYRQFFNCPLTFGQPRNEIVFDRSYLDCALVHTEHSLREFLRTAPYQLMVIDQRDGEGSLVTRVRTLIGHDFSQGFPAFKVIADALHVSAPTLRRHLKREGTTFQQLKDDCRCAASCAYLSNPDLSINAVAALMGFTDPSAFHRSFKKWTGMTPGEYRAREHRQHD